MPRLYHLNKYTPLRKSLRNNATHTEQLLWECLRQRRFHGLKWRRQEGIGRYVVDFYCPEKRLAIEVDGSHHAIPEQQAYDQERERFLNACYINVIRFTNEEVICDIRGLLGKLELALFPPTPCETPPKFGRGAHP